MIVGYLDLCQQNRVLVIIILHIAAIGTLAGLASLCYVVE
jgi:hypothetical protein